ncbi:AraC family transcriptional regulator [Megasphaera sp.]
MISDDMRIPNLQAQTPWQTDSQAFKYFRAVPQYRYEEIMSASRVLNTLTACYFPYAQTSEALSYETSTIGGKTSDDGELSHITRPEIRKTVTYIKEHLSCNLSLRTIADEVFLSESYLSKLFKQEMNMNLMQYINQCRVREGEKILASSHESVDAISRRLGYHRTSYFCKIFKQYTGETPHAYRKKYNL